VPIEPSELNGSRAEMSAPGDDVLITGIGCVGPLGSTRDEFWQRLLAGDRGVRQLTTDDLHGLQWPAAQPLDFVGAPAGAVADAGEPVIRLALVAAAEAASHAGLARGSFDPYRAGCVVGTSKGGLTAFARAFTARERGEASTMWHNVPPNVAASQISRDLGLNGPCLAPIAACATGLVCVLRGFDLIRTGICDVVVAGSSDASLHPAVLASFRRMGVLASRSAEPAAACRPFNRDRNGFAVGEGAAIFVLERRHHAEVRGATAIAQVLGGTMLADPSGMTSVDPDGESLARAISDTLQRCGVEPAAIGHVNLHGTATRTNDIAEARALKIALGHYADDVPCTALKGSIGHQLGAAGAIELAATALCVRSRQLPATVNLTDPDPECCLSVARVVRQVEGLGLKLSLGFGGHVAAALLGPVF
jgi:3-oxoacyl-[acyl-carrier-protein] synthase II